ncbi:MAG: DUF342 domain-containing protein [Lachnospiraceae bacterium]|nr:DUF342 domain-containing protein [Lachnospiraceae bacterium]
MNGYFRLIIQDHMINLEITPPTEDGKAVGFDEIMAYLHAHQVDPVDTVKVGKFLYSISGDKPAVLPLLEKKRFPVSESYNLVVSEDRMQAIARFYPPSEDGSLLTREDLIRDLTVKKITVGVDTEVIDRFLAERRYCTDYVIATGRPPKNGKDAVIEYFFNTDLSSKPKVNEDGSVDFFHLNTINHCKEGDLLARLTKAVPSFPGADIYGGMLKGREVKTVALKHGRNIRLSEDGLEMYSMINGHVSLVDDDVFVSDVYEVENVGPATGNIESEGSVVIGGNVQAGFQVKATGNVEIRGVVEGAVIEAGGDIVVGRGINGMGRGILRAGGRIICKYIENSTVTSGAYIETESILHSLVNAGTEIEVTGKRGIIAGGIVRATEKITCKTLGSAMGADTTVEVGVPPDAKERQQFLQRDLVEIQKNMKNMKVVIENCQKKINAGVRLTPEQLKYVQTLVKSYKQLEGKLAEEDKELQQLDEAMHSSGNACIIVKGEVYAGTKVTIADSSLIVKDGIKYCRLVRENGEVKLASI